MKPIIITIAAIIAPFLSFTITTAQTLPAPQNVRPIKDCPLCYTYFAMGWDSVPGATDYYIDVAEDPDFITTLPGLQNLPLSLARVWFGGPDLISLFRLQNSWEYQRIKAVAVFGIDLSNNYYCRIRAGNAGGQSINSTTLTITKIGLPHTPIFLVAGKPLTDKEIVLRWSMFYFPYPVVNFTVTVSPGNIHQTVQGRELTLKNLQPNTTYTCTVTSIENPSLQRTVSVTTLSVTPPWKREFISYYQAPLAQIIPWQKQLGLDTIYPIDSLRYYIDVNKYDQFRNFTVDTTEQLISKMQKDGIAIDTLWCHIGKEVVIFNYPILIREPDDNNNNQSQISRMAGTMIKLRKPASPIKMAQYGFALKPFMLWQYSDTFTYYRYTAFENTPLAIKGEPLSIPLSLVPNPSNELTTLRYELSQSAMTSIALYNILGQQVLMLLNESQQAGGHSIPIPLTALPTGTYFVRCDIMQPNGERRTQTLPLYHFY